MIIEITGVIFSLLYLFLEIRQQRIMWIVGFIASSFYVYIFFDAKFYADMGLNIYYVLASIYGWILWSKRTANNEAPKVTQLINHQSSIINYQLIVRLTLIFLLLFALLTFILSTCTDSPVPVGDALTTALSIVATWMLAKKILEQWWIWLFVNLLSMSLYIWRGLYPTAILFCCYAVASIIGYCKWKQSMRKL
jgi:nicotinamide mononucleotide transporter